MAATHQVGNGFTMLLGGARSGKSDLAVKLATEWDGPVMFAATAEPSDDDMANRIGRHQAQRPEHWGLVESPMLKGGEVADCDPSALVIVDCITLLVNNLIFNDRTDDQINEIQTVLHETGAVAEIETQIDALTADALAVIEQLPLAGGADGQLAEIANFLASRTS